MKKILLCLFLLTSLSFYGQVANMTHCAGDTTFNLTYHNSLLIGNLNPAETTVSYHLTAADAANGVNPISNPTNFIVPQIQGNLSASQTIYARINHLENITTNYFSLIVNPDFQSVARIEPIDCYNYGTIMLDVFGGQAPFVCFINGSPSTNNFWLYGAVSTLRIPNLVAGTYNIEIRDAIGCITHGSWTIEPSSIIPLDTPTATVINATCKGSNNGAININVTGGKSPYSYSIDNGVTYVLTNTFTNLAAGNYTVYVKDASDCIQTTSVSVTEPNLLQMSAAITKPIDCISNAKATVTATGGTAPYTYSKDGITFVQSNVFDNLVAGTYSTYVKDYNGCIVVNSIVISPLLTLTALTNVTPINCYGNNSGTITINAAGGSGQYTYSINDGPTQASNIFYNLYSGTYTIKVTSNNCIVSNVVIITEPATPLTYTYTVSNATKSDLNDGSITITATGGQGIIKYSISPSLNIFTTTNIFSNLAPHTYQFIAEDENGCYITNSFTIYAPDPLIVNAVTKPIDCVNNAIITITATGGTAPYTYSKDGITFVQSNVFDNLVTGTYTTYVKDANGYIANANPIVISPLVPLNAVAVVTPIDCYGDSGSIAINATGGSGQYTYSINDGPTQYKNTFYNLAAGTYTIKTTSNNCIISNVVIITQPTILSATITVEDQTITVTTKGGSGECEYSLDGVTYQTSNIFNNVAPGEYGILIREINGCMVILNYITINPPAPLVNGSNAITQNFTEGQTLADLKVEGENIKWYSNAIPITGKLKKVNETPLPLSTVIVDGTTYYASQTINGIESTERLAVTAKLSTLGTEDLAIKNFTYYPNPVKNVLTISNTSNIDEVTLTSIKGEILLTKRINSLNAEIDLSNFSKAVYFMKVKAEGNEKTVKLIKE